MARRKPLITHVSAEVDDWIRSSADKAGLTTSTFIRLILEREKKSLDGSS